MWPIMEIARQAGGVPRSSVCYWRDIHKFKRPKPAWNKGTKGVCKPNSGTFSKGHTAGFRFGRDRDITGANHPNWQGGRTSINHRVRRLQKYKDWREAVFNRDDYTC